jgi:aryl-alcohol dehydrogenase-like predicted oxidoreductase
MKNRNNVLAQAADENIDRRAFVVISAALTTAMLWPRLSHAESDTAQPLRAPTRKLGTLEVSSLGLGCMGGTAYYFPTPDRQRMIGVIRLAAERGVTFFDTAEGYGPYTNEEMLGEALAPFKGKVVIATKFGFGMVDGRSTGTDSKAATMRRAVEASLKRLRVDTIDLYYQHRPDPNVPVEDVAGTMKELIAEGKIRHYGLSESDADTVRRAHKVHPVTALQTEYSMFERHVESKLLPTCEELGIGFVPWAPTFRGFLAGKYDTTATFAANDNRARVPGISPEGLKANQPLLAFVRDWARRKNITPVQFSLGWLMAQKPFIVPIPGTTNPDHLIENLGARSVTFTAQELAEIRNGLAGITVMGARPS